VYDEYTPDTEIRFHAFENYWNGKAEMELLYFKIMGYERNNAILNGSIDYLYGYDLSMLPDFNANPDVKVVDNGPGTAVYSLSMNNEKINKTFRQAISYAINYSFITDNLQDGNALRAGSPVPPGILYSNWTNNYATYNVTKAREIMQSMGYGIGWDTTFNGINEADWESANFASYNFSYMTSQLFHSDLYALFYDNLDKIGIDVIDGGTSNDWYKNLFYGLSPGGHDDLDLIRAGWGPDFNDPSNMINPLYSNISASNIAQVNDPYLQSLMGQGLNETNPNARKAIYNEIQRYLVEDLMPVAYLYVPRNYDVYRNYILGYQSNSWDRVWLHGVTQNNSLAPNKIHINGNQEWINLKNAEKCTGAGTYSDPYIIKDLVIDGGNSSSGIIIENTSVYFKIENCTVYNSGDKSSDAGIKLYLVGNGTLINNNVSNNNNYGIYLSYCNNITVSSNTVNNNSIRGINLSLSNNNTVSGNTVNYNNEYGIFLAGNNNIVSGNTANNNIYGIKLWISHNCTISDNIANTNSFYGLVLSRRKIVLIINMIGMYLIVMLTHLLLMILTVEISPGLKLLIN